MARYQYWQYIVNEDGRPIGNVDIRVYLNNSPTTEANIFTHPTLGESTTSSTIDLQSDSNGYFEFWVGDETESSGGYEATQRFIVQWQRAGILLGELDNIDIFPLFYEVNEFDSTSVNKDQKNKLISNYLAYLWENHRTQTYSNNVHGIYPVDDTDTDTTYNKLVSNDTLYNIHSIAASAGTHVLAASAATTVYDPSFSWIASGSDYYVEIDHFTGARYPIVQLYNTDTGEKVTPTTVKSINTNTVRIFYSSDINANVSVIG